MDKLPLIKPARFLLIHLGLIVLSVLSFILWARLVPDSIIRYGFLFIVFGCIGGYLLWIYLFFVGFKNLDIKNNLKSDIKKSRIILASIFVIYILLIFIFMIDSENDNSGIKIILSLILASILTYLLFETVITLTQKFKHYDKKSKPRLLDYFVTMMMICFFPFGFLMMHSHLRLILKDQQMLEK